jgi:hypothetical protein
MIIRLGRLPVLSVITRRLRQVTATGKETEMMEIRTAGGDIITATSAVVKDTTTMETMMATMMATATGRLNTVIKTPLKRQLPVKATTTTRTVTVTMTDEISTMNKVPLRPSRLSNLNKRLPQAGMIKDTVTPAARRKIKILPVRTTTLSSPVYFMVMAHKEGNG